MQNQFDNIHIYDGELRTVFYADGRVERIPDEIHSKGTPEIEADLVRLWARITRRIGDNDAIGFFQAALTA